MKKDNIFEYKEQSLLNDILTSKEKNTSEPIELNLECKEDSKSNLELLLKSSITTKSKYKINGDELICKFPCLIDNENNKELNLQINNMLEFRNNISDEQFGWYLAGLLEGDGCFSEAGITITFNIYDTNLAVYIKNRIGGGHIYKGKGKWSVLNFKDKESVIKIIKLINGKLYTNCKINAMKKYNYESNYNITILPSIDFNLHSILNNFYLSGFTDSDGSFDLNLQSNNLKTRYRISQKDTTIINILKSTIGGSISYDPKIECSRYAAVASEDIEKYVNYFEKNKLLSTKYINYLKWKKAVEIKESKLHLTVKGKEEINYIKNSMNTQLYNNLIFSIL